MKTTTKIILGIIASIFVLTFIFIFGTKFLPDADRHFVEYEVPEQTKMIELKKFKTFVLKCGEEDRLWCGAKLRILPSDEESSKFQMPEFMEKHVSFDYRNDTLFLEVDEPKIVSDIAKEKNVPDSYYISIGQICYELYCPERRVDVECSNLPTFAKQLDVDTILVKSHEIHIDSCRAKYVECLDDCPNFNVNNSEIKTVKIDLDKIRYWEFDDDSKVENLILTGSGSHRVEKTDISNVLWIPKDSDAELNLRLSLKDTTQILSQKE